MNAEEIKLVINPIMETGDIKTAVNQIQGFFNKMNLSKGMKGDMENIFRELTSEVETFEKKSKEAFKTSGDVKSFENSGKKIVSLFEKISTAMNKLEGEDLNRLFTIDDSRITSMTQEITKLQQKINQLSAGEIKNITTAIQQMNTVSKSGSISKFFDAFKAGDMSTAESALKGLIQNVQAFGGSTADTKAAIDLMMRAFDDGKIDDVKSSFDMLENSLTGAKGNIKEYVSQLGILINSFATLSGNGDINQAKQDILSLEQSIDRIETENANKLAAGFNNAAPAIQRCEQNTREFTKSMTDSASRTQSLNNEIQELGQRATYFLSLENSVDLFRQGVRKAIETVKELDKAMTETAVVTDFNIGDMWDRLPEYTQMANELGVATQGVYEASTLYYQQCLKTEEVMALTNETLKMARIAGLECADATNLMTAALRGFNMEINETSAQRVNDVYSELAAITAADTNEIATAMTKTASIAASANMELETTAALLAQMIETTREPAETAGTAMKTIIARFTEMKKATSDIVSVDGEEISVNKVDAALASVGVSLKNAKGEFRDLDDVFIELASKWNSLDMMSQRYIATMAAGSRQQSRFIAMMSNYDRTLELVNAAYSSAGASSRQFEKTQESLESKLARLQNAWNTFLMGIADDKIIKATVDALTDLLNAYNNLTSDMDGVFGSAVRLGTVFAGLRLAKTGVDKLVFHFANLKMEAYKAAGAISSVGAATAGAAKVGALEKLADRFANMGTGKGFILAPKVDSTQADSWLTRFKKELAILSVTMNGAINTDGIVLNFEKMNDAMALTSATAAATGKTLEMGLSGAGTAALLASEAIEEIGEDGTKGALKAATAVKILEEKYEDLGRQITEVQARAAAGKMNPNIAANYINVLQGRQRQIQGDIAGINGSTTGLGPNNLSWADSITKKFNGVTDKMKAFNKTLEEGGGLKKAFSTAFKGVGTSLKGIGTAAKGAGLAIGKGLLAVLGQVPVVGWVAVAAITTLTAAFIALKENSALADAKRLAEEDAKALKNTQAEVDALKNKVNELNTAWSNISSAQEALNSAITGTVAWREQLIALNGEVQTLLQSYPELYKYLQIDGTTGAWSLDKVAEDGSTFEDYQKKLQEQQLKAQNKLFFDQVVANNSQRKYDSYAKAAQNDGNWNIWYGSDKSIEDSYLGKINKAAGTSYDNYEDFLKNEKAVSKVRESGNMAAKTALTYLQERAESNLISKNETAAYLSSYMSDQEQYGELTRAAVVDVGSEALDINKQIKEARDDYNYTGGTHGIGIDSIGEGKGMKTIIDGEERTIDDMQDIEDWYLANGYERVDGPDSSRHILKNTATGEYINLNAVGQGGRNKTSTFTDANGEKQTATVVSDEQALDNIRKDIIRQQTESKAIEMAKFFSENEDAAKAATGDLSADVSNIKDLVLEDGTVAFDAKKQVDEFVKMREQKMESFNAYYGNVFKKAEEQKYSQETYEAAQMLNEIEQMTTGMGRFSSFNLGTTMAALMAQEGIGGASFEESDFGDSMKNYAQTLADAGVTAESLKTYIEGIDTSSSIKGAAQLAKTIKEGGDNAAEAQAVLTADASGNGFYSLSTQLKELASTENWAKIETSLTEIYNSTGKIDADNIRELTKESSELTTMLDSGAIKAGAMAKMMEDVANGTITLADATSGLVEIYNKLYYSADLAGDAIARMEKIKIGETDTKLGKMYSEDWDAIEKLFKRGAYGDSQIDDYMAQMVGQDTWESALISSGGNKKEAADSLNKAYGLSENKGNMYGSLTYLMAQKGPLTDSEGNNILSVGPNGQILYDLTNVQNTEALVKQIADHFGVTEEYASALVGDMSTYSKTFGSDLLNNDAINGLDDFLSSRLEKTGTKDGMDIFNLNATEKELETFAKAYGKTVDELKAELKEGTTIDGKNIKIGSFDSKKKMAGGFVKETVDEKGDKQYDWYDEGAKTEAKTSLRDTLKNEFGKKDESGQLITNDQGDFSIDVELLGDTSKLESNIKNLLKDDSLRTLVLDPIIPDEQKKAMISGLLQDNGLSEGIANQLASGLISEEGQQAAQQMSSNTSTDMYNAMANMWNTLWDNISANGITIPVKPNIFGIDLPEGSITIGGSAGQISYTRLETRNYSDIYSPSGPGDGDGTGEVNNDVTNPNNRKPKGSTYTKGDDEDNDIDDGKGGSDKEEKEEKTNYAEENANKQLEALDRVRQTNDREAELIEKLPEEIQFPLKMANLGEDMFYEYQEIQINKNKLAALESQKQMEQANAEFLNKYYYFDELLGAYMYNVDAINSLSDEDRNKVEEEINSLQELQDKINDVNQELDGGKIQKIFRGLAKASTDTSKALKGTSKASDMLEEEFGNLADKFGLGDQLDKFGKSLDSAIDESKFLKKEFKGLGIVSEDMLSKIDNLPFGDATKSLIKNTLGTNENGTIGSFLGDSFGAAGEMFDGLADVLNFDMMSMGLDAFNNMKDMASKIIQQVVSVIQTVVNWWTNREDWLYNLLSAIEQEVHNFNRQEQVEERFRLYSDEGLNDLVSAWEAMRASLEKQIDLNEQLIKSRQAELQFLNLTNLPFSPAFYYDYKEERVIENPWVYDIYVLLLDLGSMIPEIGGVFSSIKQLMEDNKKRMEDAVDEIESAREQILELEKQQLELRTKYMEDEEELEQLVMDAIIEKQQEEIDELTAMSDAISEGNQKLIDALNDNLDKIREMRDNQDREEELAQKERRLAYLRQDTSGANRAQILDLQKELEDERRDYTDNLIDQKISELEKQNEDAAAQRQKQIDLLQEQLDYTEKYGLQWKEAQALIKNGFDNEGRLRVGSELFDLLMSKEDFTSLGNGSTRQNRQIMDWNVTGIAAAAYREINHIWDKGFGNFEMSNDVHDQSRLHLWEDRDIEYRQLPSWLSFLQPAYNSIQDYGWRTKQNLGSFIETGYLSGSNSSSILGKTVVPLIQRIAANIEAMVNDYKSISDAETGGAQKIAGVITSSTDNLGLSLGERILSGFSKSISTLGDDIINGVKVATQSNSSKTVTSTQNYGDIVFNNHFNSEENGDSIIERMVDFFRRGNQGLSVV